MFFLPEYFLLIGPYIFIDSQCKLWPKNHTSVCRLLKLKFSLWFGFPISNACSCLQKQTRINIKHDAKQNNCAKKRGNVNIVVFNLSIGIDFYINRNSFFKIAEWEPILKCLSPKIWYKSDEKSFQNYQWFSTLKWKTWINALHLYLLYFIFFSWKTSRGNFFDIKKKSTNFQPVNSTIILVSNHISLLKD